MRVLIVEDEPTLAQQLATTFAHAGYAVDSTGDGERAEFLGQTEGYDAIVLDLGLPRMDGLTVLRRWRDAGVFVPVLVLTSRSGWHEKVQSIDGGADDYVEKPFRMEELLARIRALIRRSAGYAKSEFRSGSLVLDSRIARVTLDGVPVKLTPHEFRILAYLLHQQGRVVSQSELTEHLYSLNADKDSNTIEVFVARLRRKLGPAVIETVRGFGYRIANSQ
jgi:two-component system OmpR family response regulator